LFDFCLWVAEIVPDMDPSDVQRVADFAGFNRGNKHRRSD